MYAKRWENKTKGTAGYSPACENEWNPGICQKPKIKRTVCKNQNFLPLNETAVDAHLHGRENRPAEDFKDKDLTTWAVALDSLKSSGVTVVCTSNPK